jgi:hypothetical protein
MNKVIMKFVHKIVGQSNSTLKTFCVKYQKVCICEAFLIQNINKYYHLSTVDGSNGRAVA